MKNKSNLTSMWFQPLMVYTWVTIDDFWHNFCAHIYADMHIKYQMRNFNQDLAQGRYCKTGNLLLSYQDTNFTSNWEILAKLLGQQICQKCFKFVLLFTFMKHKNVLPQLIKMNTKSWKETSPSMVSFESLHEYIQTFVCVKISEN